MLCLMACFYKMTFLNISEEDSTASAVIQVAEPLFCHCDKPLVYLISSVIIITMLTKVALNS
jgi:hypothetical protein